MSTLDDAIANANRNMIAADVVTRLGLVVTLCAGTPDDAVLRTVPHIDLLWKGLALDRPHETEKRLCIVLEGVPLCFICVMQADARARYEYVGVAPRVWLKRSDVKRARAQFGAAMEELIGR